MAAYSPDWTHNSLKYAKKLEEVGFSREQDIEDFRTEVKQDMVVHRHDLLQMKSELIIKLGAMMVTGIAVISAIIKLS